jgi:hypothetical protein
VCDQRRPGLIQSKTPQKPTGSREEWSPLHYLCPRGRTKKPLLHGGEGWLKQGLAKQCSLLHYSPSFKSHHVQRQTFYNQVPTVSPNVTVFLSVTIILAVAISSGWLDGWRRIASRLLPAERTAKTERFNRK